MTEQPDTVAGSFVQTLAPDQYQAYTDRIAEQQCSGGAAIDHDETGVCAHQAPTPTDTTADDIADALHFNADADSPTLYCLRDALVTMPGATPAGALDAARVLLAAHARELAELLHGEVLADRERNPGGGENHRNHAYRGGMMSARQIIGRYADDLDAQATGGES